MQSPQFGAGIQQMQMPNMQMQYVRSGSVHMNHVPMQISNMQGMMPLRVDVVGYDIEKDPVFAAASFADDDPVEGSCVGSVASVCSPQEPLSAGTLSLETRVEYASLI